MEIKKIKINPSPPPVAPNPPRPRPERAPIDLARYYEGASANTFLKDETSPKIDDPFSLEEDKTPKVRTVRITSSTHSLQPQEKPAAKTMELAHLSHLEYLPLHKVASPTGSILNQMKGEGGENEAALYARYAAALAELEKKKTSPKKKKRRGFWSFFRSLFEKE
jgi:hypothetical protein